MARASQFQSNCMQLAAQLKETRDRWQSTCATNVNLQRELMALRAQVSDWQVTFNYLLTLVSCIWGYCARAALQGRIDAGEHW